MPKTIRPLPSVDFLRVCFDYTPETGELRWKQRPVEHFPDTAEWTRWNKRCAGEITGTSNGEYLRTGIRKYPFATHRIIWKWMTGKDPPSDIDHKDRNGFNNRWDNLRLANRREAVWNRQLPRKINPARGVFPTAGGWRARIRINGKQHHLGTFYSIEEATAAYEAAARRVHGEFYCPP